MSLFNYYCGAKINKDADGNVTLTYEVPGISKDEIKIEQLEDRVKIKIKDRNPHIYFLSDDYTFGDIQAELKLGILTINIPSDEKKGREVEIVTD